MSTEELPAVPDRRRSATLNDVARMAGVSRATASKALNDRFDVNPGTRLRVRQIAEQLAFRPNANARSLLTGETRSVGLLTDDLNGRFAPQIMGGVEDAFGAERSSVLLSSTRGDVALERIHLSSLLERRVDGIVLVGQEPAPRPPLDMRLHVPVVYAFAASERHEDLSVVADNYGGARLAVEHLRSIGCTRIVHLGGPGSSVAAKERARGVLDALSKAELAHGSAEILVGDWLEEWGWSAVHRLVGEKRPVDGLICANDQIARGAIDALLGLGLRVPQDVAVIGFDNWEVLSLHGRFPFSSVDLDLRQLGVAAARKLQGRAEGGTSISPSRLVVRGSTVQRPRSA